MSKAFQNWKKDWEHRKTKEDITFSEWIMVYWASRPTRRISLKAINRVIRVTKKGKLKNVLILGKLGKSKRTYLVTSVTREHTERLIGLQEDKIHAYKLEKNTRRKKKKTAKIHFVNK